MTITEIYEAAVRVEKEIEDTPPGAPELAAIVERIGELRAELERARSVLGPLVPDSSSPPSIAEVSGATLETTLRDLFEAASSKQ